MQSLLITFCLMAAVASAASLPSARLRRDVSELAVQEPVNEYLPPAEPLEIESTTTVEPKEALTPVEDEEAATPLGEQGYEYQTVRQLRYRHRQLRDVSHLPLEYLSPVVLPPLPSRDYLPPVEEQAAPHLNNEYLPPPVHEAVKVSNDLPPVEEHEHEHEALEETTTTEAAVEETTTTTTTTTEAPITTTEAPVTEAPVEETKEVPVEEEEQEEEVAVKETPVESAELAADGYHYRQPEVIPDLSTQPEEEPIEQELPAVETVDEIPVVEEVVEEQLSPIVGEYLPPLNAIDAVAEGPANDESAVLAEDGYHYRAIKRLRF